MCVPFVGGPNDGAVECHGPVPANLRAHADAQVVWAGDTPYLYRLAHSPGRRFHYTCTGEASRVPSRLWGSGQRQGIGVYATEHRRCG